MRGLVRAQAIAAVGTILFTRSVAADDWPYYQHDALHTGVAVGVAVAVAVAQAVADTAIRANAETSPDAAAAPRSLAFHFAALTMAIPHGPSSTLIRRSSLRDLRSTTETSFDAPFAV